MRGKCRHARVQVRRATTAAAEARKVQFDPTVKVLFYFPYVTDCSKYIEFKKCQKR